MQYLSATAMPVFLHLLNSIAVIAEKDQQLPHAPESQNN